MSMAEQFDPYLAWLGIATSERPPNHYQLLGLAEFEADATRIAAAADARMREVRSYQTGPRGKYTQSLLNELAAAKLCLLGAATKTAYDAALLRQRSLAQAAVTHFTPTEPVVAPPPPVWPMPAAPPGRAAADVTTKPALTEFEREAPRATSALWAAAAVFFLLIIVAVGYAGYRVLRPRTNAPTPIAESEPTSPIPMPEVVAEDASVVILQEGSGDLNFPCSIAELGEGLERVDQQGQTYIQGWTAESAAARWRFKVVRPAIFQVQMVYTAQNTGSAAWRLTVGEESKSREVSPSQSEGATVAEEFFWRVPRGGEQTLELTLERLPEGASITLHSLRFIYQAAGRVQ